MKSDILKNKKKNVNKIKTSTGPVGVFVLSSLCWVSSVDGQSDTVLVLETESASLSVSLSIQLALLA